ncbi:COPII coat Sec23p-Sfb3p heterodimer component [Geranomyces variabilis]|uniref:COPII coat Sec23p-Sfb3p heterodimer component n=1 Tax=Geranomyces variabilis TaxID=109894 RepID=A0AAD5XRH5_9FUNG|nr:COPII coat Sec23p-Sfb3p heterodimer component [Geranomyces variabilis]
MSAPPPQYGQQQQGPPGYPAQRPRPPLQHQQSAPNFSAARPFNSQTPPPGPAGAFRPQRSIPAGGPGGPQGYGAPGMGPAPMQISQSAGQLNGVPANAPAPFKQASSQDSFRPLGAAAGQPLGQSAPRPQLQSQDSFRQGQPQMGPAPGQQFAQQPRPGLQQQTSFTQPGQPMAPRPSTPLSNFAARPAPNGMPAPLLSSQSQPILGTLGNPRGGSFSGPSGQPVGGQFPPQPVAGQQTPAMGPAATGPAALANDMANMHVGAAPAARRAGGRRMYAKSPETSTSDLYGAAQAQQGGQPYGQPGPGAQTYGQQQASGMGQQGMPHGPGQPAPGFGGVPANTPFPIPGPGAIQGFQQQPAFHPGMQVNQPGMQPGFPQGGPAGVQPGFVPPQPGYQPGMQPGYQAGGAPHGAPAGFSQPQPGFQPGMGAGGAGPAAPGPARSRIDPNQVPSPITAQEADQVLYEESAFSTMSKSVPPLASTKFRAIDDVNCNPRFIRLTTYNIPCTEELTNTTSIPLGMIVQPLAELAPDEEPIELVDCGEKGPVRCNRCKAYVNPNFMWTDGGRKFVCNLCSMENETPPEYFMNLDMSGRRMDLMRRPELRRGTVDFAAPKDYQQREPKPASFVIAIDVTWSSIQSGLLKQVVDGIRELLYSGGKTIAPGTKIGIMTFDKSVHFYNLSAGLDQPQMMVVCDVMDMFVPLNAGFLVDPIESRAVIENLLDTLPTIFQENRTHEPALGAAVQAGHAALKGTGGKLSVFQTMLPTFGPGQLKNREDAKLFGTEKERTLYEPQEYFWPKLGQDCAADGISVDMFLFPTSYMDIATVGSVSALSGGELFVYPNFEVGRDGLRVARDLQNSLTRTFGFDALLRVRVSNGLKVSDHFGNFYMKNVTDVEMGGIDASKAIGVAIKHDGKLDEKRESSFQAALLYTTATGERRIRVHNISVSNTSLLGNVFRYADMDTTICYLCKAAVAQTVNSTLKAVRERLAEKCVKVLAAYRKHAASSSSPGQLILPESYKLFALYTLCVLKLKAFRGGPDQPTDIRVSSMRMLKALGVPESVPFLYPRMMQLHDLVPPYGEIDERGFVKLPPSIRVSKERLNPAGAYVLENGQQMIIWLGRGIPGTFLRDVFGVDTLEQIDSKMKSLPVLETPASLRTRNILARLQSERQRYLYLQVVRHQMDQFGDIEFHNLLIEDQNLENLGYVDYLINVHRQIQMELSSS